MSCEFEAVDYEGKLVRCSHRNWSRHITFRHRDLEDRQEAVIAALSGPDLVYQSDEYPTRKLHYRKEVLPYPHHQDFLVIVVDYPTDRHTVAHIVTAYRKLPDEGKETLIWSKLDAIL